MKLSMDAGNKTAKEFWEMQNLEKYF